MTAIGRRPFLAASAASAATLWAGSAAAQGAEVDLQLVLAADVSRSIEAVNSEPGSVSQSRIPCNASFFKPWPACFATLAQVCSIASVSA